MKLLLLELISFQCFFCCRFSVRRNCWGTRRWFVGVIRFWKFSRRSRTLHEESKNLSCFTSTRRIITYYSQVNAIINISQNTKENFLYLCSTCKIWRIHQIMWTLVHYENCKIISWMNGLILLGILKRVSQLDNLFLFNIHYKNPLWIDYMPIVNFDISWKSHVPLNTVDSAYMIWGPRK